MFNDCYRHRRVLVTGDTGFKGSWLSYWLCQLGADVSGLGLQPPTDPNLFSALRLDSHIDHVQLDIRDADRLQRFIQKTKPEIVFHLAAQPLVRESYLNPKATFDTNVGGVVNLLECIRDTPSVKACVVVTSDKCYENREWLWGYRESEAMGGHDPYSASKGAAELVVASYRRSFFENGSLQLATARAGNVIGGGDWAKDRIITDFVTNIVSGEPLTLRYPGAIRPWQHVLEPLSGYLTLAAQLAGSEGKLWADAWNFGPSTNTHTTVLELAEIMVQQWGSGSIVVDQADLPHEASLLQLDCSKANSRLNWRGVWDVATTVRHTVQWYQTYYQNGDVIDLTKQQLEQYQRDASTAGVAWADASNQQKQAA